MSSADSGRYQSRLFNFVYKQSRRFTRSCDRVFRNIQVTTNWVAAVGLYPFLLLFQSTRSTAQQIHQAVQQSLPQLPAPETEPEPPSADTPIQQVLLSIDALSAQLVISPSGDTRELGELGKLGKLGRKATHHSPLTTRPSPLATRPSIQGIATQLSSQTLVLVTAQNEILDILTSTQQEKLQAQIITAIADYWRYQREQGKLGRLGENSEFQIFSVLAFLDRTVAVVESNHVVPGKEVAIALFSKANQSSGLVGRIQTQIGRFLSKDTPAINPNGGSTMDTMRIRALIGAAIDYFFGTRPSKRVEQTIPTNLSRISPNFPQTVQQLHPSLSSKNSQTQSKQLKERYQAAKLSAAKLSSAHLPPSSQPVNSGIEDPWLCESDLFGESVTNEKLTRHQLKHSTSKTKMSGSRNSVSSQDSTRYYLGNLVNSFRKFLPQPKPTSEIAKGQKINKGQLVGGTVSIKQSSPLLKSPRQDISGKFAQSCNSNTQIEPAPDWIETNATVMGYVKHPLEQLLAWLDGAMLWLEEVLLKFWQWLQKIVASGTSG